MIMKLQRNLNITQNPTCLIYNRDKSVLVNWPMTRELFKLFPKINGHRVAKVYHNCTLCKGMLEINAAARPQEW